jgi:DNA invertase Pin-like site-specific DNA recombinase
MIAAIYARKSTEQRVVDEQKSVARQVEHARAYAEREGLAVSTMPASSSTTASPAPNSRSGPDSCG